jgi:hypothetical protein
MLQEVINCNYMAINPAPKPMAIIQAKTNCPPDVTARAFALLCAVAVPLATAADPDADPDADPEAAAAEDAEAREERALLALEEIEATAEAAAELAEEAIEAAPPATLLLHVS